VYAQRLQLVAGKSFRLQPWCCGAVLAAEAAPVPAAVLAI